MEMLLQYKKQYCPNAQPRDWVLPGRRCRPIEMGWFMGRYIRPVAEKLGISSNHWHAFRHLNNSMMQDEGVDVKTRMDRLGHVSEGVNMIYTHVGEEAQREASDAVLRKLQSAASQIETAKNSVLLKVAGNVAESSREEVSHELSY